MTIDDYLEKLLDAVDKNNYWDAEAYAQYILDRIHHVNPQFRNELKDYLEKIISSAKKEYDKEKFKENLIDEIIESNKKSINQSS